jgi:hypothetical protein
LDGDLLAAIDEVLGDELIERDPSRTKSPERRPGS